MTPAATQRTLTGTHDPAALVACFGGFHSAAVRRQLTDARPPSDSNIQAVLALNGAEQGQTVFVIGSSSQLNSLSPPQIDALGRRPTIGLNRTQYAVRLRYFLSAYPSEVQLARHHSADLTVINMRPVMERPLIPGTLAVKRVRYKLGDPLSPVLQPPEPTLHTLRNVALGATHLALILGARRIVYIGVQQTSKLHYYDELPELRERIAEDLRAVSPHLFKVDHPYATLDKAVELLRIPVEQLAGEQFYTESHQETFQEYFAAVAAHGVETFATTAASVIAAAGAPVVSVDEALSW